MWDRSVTPLKRRGYSSETRVCCWRSLPWGPAATHLLWLPCPVPAEVSDPSLWYPRSAIASRLSAGDPAVTAGKHNSSCWWRQMGCPAPSWPQPGTGGQPHPLPLLRAPWPSPLFWGVRGIPGARETQALTVPHQQRYVLGCRQGFTSACWVSPALRLGHHGAGWCFKCPGSFGLAVALPVALGHVKPTASRQEKTSRSKRERNQECQAIVLLVLYFLLFSPEFFNSGQKWSKGLGEELSEASLDEGTRKKKGLEKQNTCFVTELPFHRHVEGSMLLDPPESMGYSGQLGYQGIKLSSFCRKATCCVAVVLLWGINSASAKLNTLRGRTGFLHLERAWFWDTGKHHHFLFSTLIWLSQLLAAWTCKWRFL